MGGQRHRGDLRYREGRQGRSAGRQVVGVHRRHARAQQDIQGDGAEDAADSSDRRHRVRRHAGAAPHSVRTEHGVGPERDSADRARCQRRISKSGSGACWHRDHRHRQRVVRHDRDHERADRRQRQCDRRHVQRQGVHPQVPRCAWASSRRRADERHDAMGRLPSW